MGYASKYKLAFMGIILLLLVVASLLGYLYFLKKSPKYLYLRAEAKQVEKLIHYWAQHDGSGREVYKVVQEQPFRLHSTLSANVQFEGLLGSLLNQHIAGIQESLEKTRLSLTFEQQPQTEQYLFRGALNLGDARLLMGEVYQEPGLTAFKLPDLAETYFYLANQQFGAVAQRVNPAYQKERQAPELSKVKDGAALVEQFQQNLVARYGRYMWAQLEEEMFTLEKVPFSTEEGQIRARKISLQMSAAQLDQFFRGLREELQADQELAELLLSLDLQEQFNLVMEHLEELRFPNGISMQVILDKKGHILARKAELAIVYPNLSAFSEGIRLNYASKLTERDVLIDTDFAIPLKEDVMERWLPSSLSRLIGDVQLSGIRGSVKQRIDRQALPEVFQHQVNLRLFMDANSSLLGRQSLGLQAEIESSLNFTDELLFPNLAEDRARPLLGLAEGEWQAILSELENYLYKLIKPFQLSS